MGRFAVAGEETREVVGPRGLRGKNLLDFFAACELEEDRGAFNGGAAFKVVAGCPRVFVGVFGWGVESAEIDYGCFEGEIGVCGGGVVECSVGIVCWGCSLCEDF